MTDIEADIRQRQAQMAKVYVRTPQVERALKLIHEVRTAPLRPSGGAVCGIVAADTGWGKTMILDRYASRADVQPDGTRKPIVKFSMPARFSFLALAASALAAVDARPLPGQDFNAQWARFCHYLRERQVELLLVDEANHLVDRKGRDAKIPYAATDVFKADILDGAKVPIVFAGLPVALEMFNLNPQLLTRRLEPILIDRYDPDDAASWESFKLLIGALELAAGFLGSSVADDEALLRRLHIATRGGNHSAVYYLFYEAVAVALRRGRTGFDQDVLATAAAKRADPTDKRWVNAFSGSGQMWPERLPDETRVTTLHKRRGRKLLSSPE